MSIVLKTLRAAKSKAIVTDVAIQLLITLAISSKAKEVFSWFGGFEHYKLVRHVPENVFSCRGLLGSVHDGGEFRPLEAVW